MPIAIVYCDNENMPYHKYDDILAKVLIKGCRVLCYKIFGGVREISKLDETYRLKHNYILCSKPLVRNKNSLDISIVIEIMRDLCNNVAVDTFIICSNDTDYIPLCKEIQMKGKSCWLASDKKDNNEVLSQIYDKILDLSPDEIEKVEPKKNKSKKLTLSEQLDLVLKTYVATNENYNKDNQMISMSRICICVKEAGIDWTSYKTFKMFLNENLPDGFGLEGSWIFEV